jgi:hypothetical protein
VAALDEARGMPSGESAHGGDEQGNESCEMLLKCTSISSARAARRPNDGRSALLPSRIHRPRIVAGLGIRGKERPGMDHMGVEMLVPDRPPVPVDSRSRGRPSDSKSGEVLNLAKHI